MKAKRGDSVAILETITVTYAHGTRATNETVRLGEVTSVTRDGLVKAWREYGYSSVHPIPKLSTPYVIPATLVAPSDVEAVALAHTWPGHDYPKYFDSMAEVREALKAYRLESVA